MKQLPLLALATGALMWMTSCEEKGPLINFEDAEFIDTTYVTTPEAAQTKKVLVEEFTGASCTNCPAAADKLENLNNEAAFKDRLVVIGLHMKDLDLAKPVKEIPHKYDFTSEEAKQIGDQIYGGVANIPAAGFDRMPVDNDIFLYTPKWATAVQQRLSKATSDVNVHVSSIYNEATREAIITVKVAYVNAMTGNHNLSVALLESKLIDPQKFTDRIEEEYEFNHVFHDMVTPLTGEPFLEDIPSKEAGRVYERIYKVTIDEDWVPANCSVVAFVHNNSGEDKEVHQVAEAHLHEP